ncbi:uncharacterized protein LOC133713053 isoform X2 [Rosa rugosa]|uniref:uncharacterized protein LOC133713053 isoform X2 n=1 Tax=Rosa rugosa TaxID=74645 RepID=UPI002B414067|nr:uncharacterized protein LOC133713053 isoform X2 [Rosa rugosa]
MMKTTALLEKNPLPPGAKAKSKARQHAKSKRKEKLKKEEKSNTSSSEETGDTSFYDSESKFFMSENYLAAMNKERLLGLGPDQEMYPLPVTVQECIAFFDIDVEEYEFMADRVRKDCSLISYIEDRQSRNTNTNTNSNLTAGNPTGQENQEGDRAV